MKNAANQDSGTASLPIAYKVVADRIIDIIETTGSLPWRRPWRQGRKAVIGKNHVSQHTYSGINAFLTALITDMHGFDSNEWVTFKQAKDSGGHVKKGAKGTPCFFFMTDEKEEEKADTKTGKTKKRFIARYYTIFNLSQCEGIDYKALSRTDEAAYTHNPIEEAEKLLASFKGDIPPIKHDQANRAFYDSVADYINVPEPKEFRQREAYYSTKFHELVHSTGHVKRLNRKSLTAVAAFGSHEYSKEELVAEFGACFLSSDCGILQATEQNSAAYLQGWLKALKENPRWLVDAANQAQKAVNYLKYNNPQKPE